MVSGEKLLTVDKTYYNIPMDPFACLHGAFHWLGRYKRKIFVVSFSISDEVYWKIQLLEPMMNGGWGRTK